MAAKKQITGKSQKGQQVIHFTEEQARDYFEKLIWPDGQPACRNCGSVNCYRMKGKSVRPGLCRCRDCNKQFTVTVGTIFEDSHLPLATWVKAIHLMTSSKKGISALQLQRNLGIGSYRTAWFMAHRIRLAMRCDPVAGLLKGAVQVDETYVGPSRHAKNRRPSDAPRKVGRGTSKQPVMALVETDGRVHSRPIDRIDAKTLGAAMRETVDPSAVIVTDEYPAYPKAARGFAGHRTVRHSAGEYVGPHGLHTNTAESYFALLKRGLHGAFHHVSRKHLHRYCDEFSYRWNGRKVEDSQRRDQAVRQAKGKRLFYHQPVNPPKQPPAPGEQLMPFDC